MKITNYKTYLMARKIKDSTEAYRAYCEEFEFPQMHITSEANKANYIKVTYKYRFTSFNWA